MFKLNPVEYDEFIQEVESRMLEETDYSLELDRSMELSEKSRHLKNIIFPRYYPEFSSEKILTMDWIDGRPLGEVLNASIPPDERNKLGQALWDFYHFQMHTLKAVHADPHPGNFIITKDYKLGIIDFGCVKVIPEDFYKVYFKLHDKDVLTDLKKRDKTFRELRFIHAEDTKKEEEFFTAIFVKLVGLLSRPFHSDTFDFADDNYFDELYSFGEKLSTMKELRESKRARGVGEAVYLNRTYFGLFTILHDLKATIKTAW
jgi:predicted unusual protein kinase regulating ubiquinone biosynthesis (AarF/ABC1/UbiB family)